MMLISSPWIVASERPTANACPSPVIDVTMATSPKSAGVRIRARTPVEMDVIRNWAPWELIVANPPRTDRPFRSACRCSVQRASIARPSVDMISLS